MTNSRGPVRVWVWCMKSRREEIEESREYCPFEELYDLGDVTKVKENAPACR
jgi:hypothetical protein